MGGEQACGKAKVPLNPPHFEHAVAAQHGGGRDDDEAVRFALLLLLEASCASSHRRLDFGQSEPTPLTMTI